MKNELFNELLVRISHIWFAPVLQAPCSCWQERHCSHISDLLIAGGHPLRAPMDSAPWCP